MNKTIQKLPNGDFKVIKLLILALFLTTAMTAQTRMSITQDARLAFYGDDKGNEAYTPNLTLRFSQVFVEGKFFDPITVVEYEIADLNGGLYSRWGFGLGMNVNKLLPYTEFQFHLSSGFITRNGRSYANHELVGNISFGITDDISLILEGQRASRTDLKNQPIIYSGKIGLRFTLKNKPLFKD
jgi:hypothetical protein